MPDEFKYVSSCGKIKPTNNLNAFRQHLRSCAICRENCSPEVKAEIKERYGEDIEGHKIEAETQTLEKEEKKEVPQKRSHQDSIQRLDSQIASLPSIQRIATEIGKTQAQMKELAEATKTILQKVLQSQTSTQATTEKTETIEEKTNTGEPEKEQKEPTGEPTPEEIQKASDFIARERLKRAGVQPSSEGGGFKEKLEMVTAAIAGLKELGRAWKGGGGEAPATPETLINKVLASMIDNFTKREDPGEIYRQGGQDMIRVFGEAVKLVKAGGTSESSKNETVK